MLHSKENKTHHGMQMHKLSSPNNLRLPGFFFFFLSTRCSKKLGAIGSISNNINILWIHPGIKFNQLMLIPYAISNLHNWNHYLSELKWFIALSACTGAPQHSTHAPHFHSMHLPTFTYEHFSSWSPLCLFHISVLKELTPQISLCFALDIFKNTHTYRIITPISLLFSFPLILDYTLLFSFPLV